MRRAQRAATLDRLERESFDLVVIGAGIVGARIALEAARAGANVALLDAGDFGSGTSSASSKLIHGGLRYFALGDLRLVRESNRERRALLDRIAPHLVRRLRLLLPVYRGGPHGLAAVTAGLAAYAGLSGLRHPPHRMLDAGEARRLVPSLRTDGLLGAGLYEDAQTDDARLVLATVRGAAAAGAAVLNHAPVEALEVAGGRVAAVRAGGLGVRCRHLVNATGPWVDRLRRLEDPAAPPIALLSKGVHLLLDQPEPWAAAVTTPIDGSRVALAVPWAGMLLLGTTDTEYEGDPDRLEVGPEDVATVLGEAAVALPRALLDPRRVRHSFAGLRVLPRTAGATARIPRDELIRTGPAGMVSVAGGKLTTHRRIALRALRELEPFRRLRLSGEPLCGAGPAPPRPAGADPLIWEHLLRHYGSEAGRVAGLGLEPVHPHGPDVWGQVHHAARSEWAEEVEDVVRRRTTLEVRGLATPEVREAVGQVLSGRRQPAGSPR